MGFTTSIPLLSMTLPHIMNLHYAVATSCRHGGEKHQGSANPHSPFPSMSHRYNHKYPRIPISHKSPLHHCLFKIWLVVYLPLWKHLKTIRSSVGMIFRNLNGKKTHQITKNIRFKKKIFQTTTYHLTLAVPNQPISMRCDQDEARRASRAKVRCALASARRSSSAKAKTEVEDILFWNMWYKCNIYIYTQLYTYNPL